MFRPNQMGVYIHWPFCAAKCPYCDFNSHVREGIDQEQWKHAYLRSLEYYANILGERQVVSIFFGGGTPSLMPPSTTQAIVDKIQSLWPVANDLEVTLEANPTSVEAECFQGFRDAGVNRVSLGVQAMNDNDLAFLGREHTVDDALNAVEIAKRNFDRYSFDLIYARPNQTLKQWEAELTEALKYASGHMSLYQLTIERNTPFYMRHSRGEFSIPDDVGGADFYILTQEIMSGAGMEAYEISNHATSDQECRHNLIYWHMADYIGIGPGAHGRFINGDTKYASRDHSAPEIWLQRVLDKGYGSHDMEALTLHDRFVEALMMGLRLKQGISMNRCEELSGLSFDDVIDPTKFEAVQNEGWIKSEGDTVSLTTEGMLRSNSLIPYIIRDQ